MMTSRFSATKVGRQCSITFCSLVIYLRLLFTRKFQTKIYIFLKNNYLMHKYRTYTIKPRICKKQQMSLISTSLNLIRNHQNKTKKGMISHVESLPPINEKNSLTIQNQSSMMMQQPQKKQSSMITNSPVRATQQSQLGM